MAWDFNAVGRRVLAEGDIAAVLKFKEMPTGFLHFSVCYHFVFP
jgi:hypothetical protein